MPTPRSRFTFDERSGEYRDARGRAIPDAAIRDVLGDYITVRNRDMAALAESLRTGTISVATWQSEMATAIKGIHITAALLANGGRDQMTPAKWGRVGSLVKEQYKFLRDRALAIQTGAQGLGLSLTQRAMLYTQAARGTYYDFDRRVKTVRGFTEEMRDLHAAESCPDCVGYAGQGWVDIGTLPLPGSASKCGKNCRCQMFFRKAA